MRMHDAEESTDDKDERTNFGPVPVSGKPSKTLFTMMEEEAGGASPDPADLGDYNQVFEYTEINHKDYHSSNFPSLLSDLGPSAKHKPGTSSSKKKKQQKEDNNEKGRHKHRRETLVFGEQMKRLNETRWLKIESVAKEKMDYYDRYVSDMTMKIKQQRKKINQRAEQLLRSLEQQEEQKRADRLFDSPYGRIWRHHRAMQRRAYSLEPIRPTY
ncbi:uncharacterized protein LOC132720658 isoform X2 [Ruditapes philippinarum]|uniref:uncharacterized protein LOC132720658 isoform X2 n=1 Tax=Ruditapes philippinarum TaxID=129788 RepID=UPI00295A77E4|nr:uncharacterized protein LOC132720658 isoform X2 [Ruditapes philippinarum]